MFLIDDILLKSVGIEIPGLSFLWVLEQIEDIAMKELYDPDKVKGQVKENRMLFEFGEISKEEYEETNARLLRELEIAERRR